MRAKSEAAGAERPMVEAVRLVTSSWIRMDSRREVETGMITVCWDSDAAFTV
jgi:hypothetical protein